MNRFWKEYYIFMEKKTNTLKKALTGIILSIILIVIDQVTKLMAIHGLMNQQPFVIWDGVFELHYLENRGAAFGILQGKKIFFVFFNADRTLSDRVSLPETYSRREKVPSDGRYLYPVFCRSIGQLY